MKKEHNIDRLFQESFKDFEVEAPKNAWSNIEKELKSSNKKVVPLWQKLGAAAAVIAIIILAGSQWFIGVQNKQENSFVEKAAPDKKSNGLEDKSNRPASIVSSVPVDENDNKDSNSLLMENDKSITTESQESNSSKRNTSFGYRSSVATSINAVNPNGGKLSNQIASVETSEQTKDINNSIISDLTLNAKPNRRKSDPLVASNIEDDRAKFTKKAEQKSLIEVAKTIYNETTSSNTKDNSKIWFVKPQISPTFYGNLGSGSSIDNSLSQNSSSADVNVTYGVNVAYQVSERIKIRSGVNRLNLNYSTNDVFVIPGGGYSSFSNVSISGAFESSVLTEQQVVDLNTQGILGRFPTETSQLQQQLGFIEIPMELEYKILDKDININIIGGASTLLLNDNNIDITTGNASTSIGEANNLNDVSFSTNLALGFDYDISERLMLNLEPTFKYQINTFQSGTTGFQPYFFGIYSGFVFKF